MANVTQFNRTKQEMQYFLMFRACKMLCNAEEVRR